MMRLALLAVGLLLLSSQALAWTSPHEMARIQDYVRSIRRPAVVTITTEDDDVIDCVNIHDQLALQHPALKDHKVQMAPSSFPPGFELPHDDPVSAIIEPTWGGCPEGTVPHARIEERHVLEYGTLENYFTAHKHDEHGQEDHYPAEDIPIIREHNSRFGRKLTATFPPPAAAKSPPPLIKSPSTHSPPPVKKSPPPLHPPPFVPPPPPIPARYEYAIAKTKSNLKGSGARGSLSMWNPKVEDLKHELTNAQVFLSTNLLDPTKYNSIQTGWHVIPKMYNQKSQVRFFTYFEVNYSKKKFNGCFNHRCPGFVQVSSKFHPGDRISPVSTYEGDSYEILYQVFFDKVHKNWWVTYQNITVGYYPAALFNYLNKDGSVTDIAFGGRVYNYFTDGRHTKTEMGSGYFPEYGLFRSCFMRNIKVILAGNQTVPLTFSRFRVTNKNCYALARGYDDQFGSYVYIGGPGYSEICPKL